MLPISLFYGSLVDWLSCEWASNLSIMGGINELMLIFLI